MSPTTATPVPGRVRRAKVAAVAPPEPTPEPNTLGVGPAACLRNEREVLTLLRDHGRPATVADLFTDRALHRGEVRHQRFRPTWAVEALARCERAGLVTAEYLPVIDETEYTLTEAGRGAVGAATT